MAKKSDGTAFAKRTAAQAPAQRRRQGFGAVDAAIITAMAAVSVAAGVGLHLQAELRTVTSGVMAGALFTLLALIAPLADVPKAR